MSILIRWFQDWIGFSPEIRSANINALREQLKAFSEQMAELPHGKTVELFFSAVGDDQTKQATVLKWIKYIFPIYKTTLNTNDEFEDLKK